MSKAIDTIFVGLIAFAGGYVAASLFNSKNGVENRKWLEDKSQKLVKESEKRIDQVSKGIRKTVNDSLPDLYEATEGLVISDKNNN